MRDPNYQKNYYALHREEKLRKNAIWRSTHRQEVRLRSVYYNMLSRCGVSPNGRIAHAEAMKNYARRGITVCKEWIAGFSPFCKWALSHGYSQGLEIDRIDNNRGYSPDNCRWVTRTINNRNKRSNVRYQFHGEPLTLPEIYEKHSPKVSFHTFETRVQAGWELIRALTDPVVKAHRIRIIYPSGERKEFESIREAMEVTGKTMSWFYNRLAQHQYTYSTKVEYV